MEDTKFTPVNSVSVILHARATNKVALARRLKEQHFGKLQIPGGKIDEGEHPDVAVRRELLEETGLETNCPILPYGSIPKDVDGYYFNTLYLCQLPDEVSLEHTEPDKAGPWKWLGWSEFSPIELIAGTGAHVASVLGITLTDFEKQWYGPSPQDQEQYLVEFTSNGAVKYHRVVGVVALQRFLDDVHFDMKGAILAVYPVGEPIHGLVDKVEERSKFLEEVKALRKEWTSYSAFKEKMGI